LAGPSGQVLDAGTGTGRYALFLAEQGKRVMATDQSAKMAHVDGKDFPFPACHASVDEYTRAALTAGAEIVVTIDVPMQQQRGLFPGPFVMLARKPTGARASAGE
jgi:sugar/nucleoside kinase (ribokinase family)